MDESLLKQEEKAVFTLRALYRKYGYRPFRMSKFEEYDFYVQNKDFLVSDRIITFNDTDGKLLALKPDVTLSIIKSVKDEPGCKQKVCYNENVYRVSTRTNQYKEILQTGLECIGDIDIYDLFEVVSLAAQSLLSISENFVLELSHIGILEALLEECALPENYRKEVLKNISEKNTHDLKRICLQAGVSDENAERLVTYAGIHGDRKSVLASLEALCTSERAKNALAGLRELSELLQSVAYADRICFDCSLVLDMNYYNGIVFNGYLDGICESILSGGQYDRLLARHGRRSGAIGFALYLDLLEELQETSDLYDVDVLLLYDDKTDPQTLCANVESVLACGKSVSAQKSVPPKLKYRELIRIGSSD